MESKHIVIDARIRPSSTGRYADRLLEHLQKIDKVNRYTILLDPNDTWEPESKNFVTKVCPYRKFSFNPIDQISFAVFLSNLKPDLVHFTMTPQEPIFYRGKRVTTTHDLTMLRYARAGRLPLWVHKLRMIGYRFLLWYSHKTSQQIIVPTEFVRQDIISLHSFTKNKITVTLESSEPPISGAAKKIKNINKPYIFHVGSPFPHKNIDRLIDAFVILKQKHSNLRLVLAGKKEYFFDKLINEKINQSQYKDDIFVTGFVEDSQLKWLYENAACYVLPSLSEGFGLPGLEAMAHGTALVSSNATCLPEVYGDAATYFDPQDTQSMADAINQVLTDSKLANKLRTLGHKRIACFSWEKMAKQTLTEYRKHL
ncbi:glycosyltransferase family 4 protein [Candidatus Saccharibacteria bacterium]|nr:glycosyltransferase family 4 protein [Candidatus Saccharibacteria bacterium]